jgi:hypothetical protein
MGPTELLAHSLYSQLRLRRRSYTTNPEPNLTLKALDLVNKHSFEVVTIACAMVTSLESRVISYHFMNGLSPSTVTRCINLRLPG